MNMILENFCNMQLVLSQFATRQFQFMSNLYSCGNLVFMVKFFKLFMVK